MNINLEEFGGSWHHSSLKGPCPKDFFIVHCMGP